VKIGRWILLALVLACAGLLAWKKYAPEVLPGAPDSLAATPESMVPDGVRIKVEVQNATKVPGLARRATQFLRDRGLDVVAIRTATEQRNSTLVLDRSNHPAWALLVAQALGSRTEPRPDTTRYLDVTVLLGDDWRPPPLPFYP
jgi:hypothetical protein